MADENLDDDQKNIDDENVDDDQELDDPLKDIKVEDIDKLDEAKAKELAKKALDVKQKLYARAKSTSDKFKEYKTKNPPKKDDKDNKNNQNQPPEISKRLENLEMVETKRQFGYENGLSPEETDQVFKMTGNKPTKKDLENPFIKGGLSAIRREKRVKDNTPEPGASGFSAGGKSWEQMTPAEKKANFKEYVKSRKK